MTIRKNSKGEIYEKNDSKIGGIIISILPSLLIIGAISRYLDFRKRGELIYFICISIIVIGLFLYLGIKSYISASKLNKAKNFKKNGGGIIKKVKITSIEHVPENSGNGGNNRYYLESRGGEVTYYSDSFRTSKFITMSNELPTITGGELNKLKSGGHITVTHHYKGPQTEPKIHGIIVHGHTIMVGDTVTVYLDPDDTNNYWMDIDFLFDR